MKKINVFWSGFSSILALFPNRQRRRRTTVSQIEADVWNGVGQSIKDSLSVYGKEIKVKTKNKAA